MANTGAFAFLRNIGSPFTWSMCSCVSTTAEISSSVSDSAFSAVVILRSDTPRSIRIAVPSAIYKPQLPLEPLAIL